MVPDALAPFLSFLWPHAFSAWNTPPVFMVGLPCTRHAHFDIVTTWRLSSFHSEFVIVTVLTLSSIFILKGSGVYEGRGNIFISLVAKNYWNPSAQFSLPGFIYPACFAPHLAKSFILQNTVYSRGNKWDKSPSCHLPK